MQVRIETRGGITLVGMSFYGNPFSRASAWDEDNEIGSLWKRFLALRQENPASIRNLADDGSVGYELHILAPESEKTGRYEVFVGVEVLDLEAVPLLCCAKFLPPADYAILTVSGEEIRGDGMAGLYSEFLPGIGRRADDSFSFERYDRRFKGMDRLAESEMEYFIPLMPRDTVP